MTTAKLTAGSYDATDNVLHLWFPQRVELKDEETVRAFFDEVLEDWIKPRPRPPYLLVNFGNLHIRPNMAPVYSKSIARFQSLLLGTFRYGMPASFTGVAVALGNLELNAPAHIFADEQAARDAIRVARERADANEGRAQASRPRRG